MSFIWQLSLSKTIVDSLTLKIPGRILRFSDNGSDEIVQIFTCKTKWRGKLAKFSAPYLNQTSSPLSPPPPPFSRGEAILMHFQPGKSDCPSFIQIPSQFSQKNLPFEGQDVEALSTFLLHISFQVSHLILEKHPEKLLICCRQGTVCQGQHISHKNCKYTCGLHYLTARIER